MSKVNLLSDIKKYYAEKTSELIKAKSKKPTKNQPEDLALYENIKKENSALLSTKDKIYQFIIVVMSLALCLNLTLSIEIFFQNGLEAKFALSLFSLFIVLLFLFCFVSFAFISDRLLLVTKYQEHFLRSIPLSEKIKYQIKKEFNEELNDLLDLKNFLKRKEKLIKRK